MKEEGKNERNKEMREQGREGEKKEGNWNWKHGVMVGWTKSKRL